MYSKNVHDQNLVDERDVTTGNFISKRFLLLAFRTIQ